MTRPSDKHLDEAELDALVLRVKSQVPPAERLTNSFIEDAQRHLESCPDCSLRVQMHRSVQNEMSRIRVRADIAPGPDCVEQAEWLRMAAEVLPETKTRELMKHASQCGHCGPLLKSAIETLSDEVTPKEDQMLASLKSTRSEWQRGMAQTLQGSARDTNFSRETLSRRWFSWPRQAFAVAGLAAVVGAIWLGSHILHPPAVEQLLAQAYTEHRTLEVRISGARFAPLRVERGQGESNLDRPPSLLRAEALISENLRKSPNDPTWLRAKAQADLLDQNYESAIKSLEIALESQPNSTLLLTDLASAYFERAEAANRPVDYGNALECLGKALGKAPDDPVALFNRAVTAEKLFLYTQAIDDWEHYLRVESTGEWADDARRHLAGVKEKIQQHQQSLDDPMLEPREIVKRAGDATLQVKIDRRIEQYLHLAVAAWLPQAFPIRPPEPSSTHEAQTALTLLAVVTESLHADPWLTDLLKGPQGAHFPSAVQALATAVESNDRGDYLEGRNSAVRAAELFQSVGNLPGALRARAEEVYADHLLYDARQCMNLVGNVSRPLELHGYAWLQAEVTLEESNCAALLGELGHSKEVIVRGIREARSHKYLGLYLRGLGFQADAYANQGDPTTGFLLATEGLDIFWSSQVDIVKGYNLYTDLDTAADDLKLANLQVAVWKQATAVIDQHPDVLQRAMAHRWYGNSAYLADMPKLAADEFTKASALFASAPRTAATTRDYIDAEIWLAHIETRQGDLQQAAARLQQIQPVVDAMPSFSAEIAFYGTQADLSMHREDWSDTESALRSAIFLAEWALRKFPSLTERLQWARQTRNAYYDLVAWKLRQGDATAALELWEWYKGAGLRAHRSRVVTSNEDFDRTTPPDAHNAPPLPVPDLVQNQLPFLREKTVVVYATYPEGVAIWSYDDRGVLSYWVSEPLSEVKDLAIRLERLCADPTSDLAALRATSESLYHILIAPIEARLDSDRTLVFEPDDVLDHVAFEALIDHTGHYLVERKAVTVSPGLYRGMQLRPAEAISHDSTALVVSVSAVPQSRLVPLSDADEEAEAVAGNFPLALRLSGPAATLSGIREQIRGVSLFHFVGHAITSADRTGLLLVELDPRTQQPRLFTAETLGPGDVSKLQLAVLSACQTRASADMVASGNEGVAQMLLRAGVPHVITSRWKIDSAETVIFMKQFYAQLLAGQDVTRSLHSAQLALAEQPASAHPYYWAAFEGQGL